MAERLDIVECRGFGLATVMARRGADVAAIGAALGVQAPERPGFVSAGGLSLIGTGPGQWLAQSEVAEGDFASGLAARLAGLAYVSDQSGGYEILRLSGPGARTLLQRGLAVDLHPDMFPPGSAAVSQIAHMGVILWAVDDRPVYNLAFFRSHGHSLRHWIEAGRAAL